jgi:hypothetical protein
MSQYRDYPEYLESAHWAFTRKKILERDTYKCVVCSKPAEQVHHINYRDWVDVIDDDLMSVCEECHCKIHIAIDRGYIPTKNKSSKRKTLDGLEALKYSKPLSAKQKKERPRFILDKDFCLSIDKLSMLGQQLISGILKRKLPYSFTSFEGISVPRKVYNRMLDVKRRDKPTKNKPSNIRRFLPLNPNPPWLLQIEEKLKKGEVITSSERSSYLDRKRMTGDPIPLQIENALKTQPI